ncbi:MAG: hypothetical protein KU37_09520 [Sulfuricurvum sp. PC08-66]|nr:MAG: hypothetical protein KU37_09520 [Sulfuricurvum sp. PC08-66]
MNERIIIFGFGPYGEEIAKSLRLSYNDIIVVDQYERHIARAHEVGFLQTFIIDVHDERTFAKLPIDERAVLFCAFEDEAYNTFLTITLRSFHAHHRIIAIAQSSEGIHKLEIAGASKVMIVEETGANIIYNMLVHPHVTTIFDEILYGQEGLMLFNLVVSEQSAFNGLLLSKVQSMIHQNVIIIGLIDKEHSEEFVFATTGYNHAIDAGDSLVIIGPKEEVLAWKEEYSR